MAESEAKHPGSDPLSGLETDRASWLGEGPESDVVLSSRVRLARNIAGFKFVNRCDAAERRTVLNLIKPRLLDERVLAGNATSETRPLWLEVHELDRPSRDLLVERNVISPQLARGQRIAGARGGTDPRAVVVAVPDERVSVMVNEEDHLRLQCIQPGLSLRAAFERLEAADDAIERTIDYAYSARFGYLTACPTNIGTGARLSVMLHLPGLQMLNEIEKVKRAASDMSLAVRGFWGEGSEHAGAFYQVSNQTTLGRAEPIMLADLEHTIVPQIIEYERRSRERLLSKRRISLEDTVFRALGTLCHARKIASGEAMQRLSELRLGAALGLLSSPSTEAISKLLLAVQSAHLQRRLGGIPSEQVRIARASFLREALRDAKPGDVPNGRADSPPDEMP